jgi:hypothetical protein
LDILIRNLIMGSLKIQEAFLVCWQYAFNLSSFEREADGSIIQDPVYGGNKYDYGQTGRRFEV